MQLITQAILKAAPPLYSQDGKDPKDVPIVAKFFNPCGRSTWFMTEYDPADKLGYGFVIGELGPDCDEVGYFSIAELEAIELEVFGVKCGLGIERDIHYRSQTLAEVMPL